MISWTEKTLRDECQKHIRCDLHSAQCVNQRVASLTPEIVRVAWHDAIEVKENRLPVPEPAITNGEEERRYTKTPNDEINPNIPSRMDLAAVAVEESDQDDEGVVEEGEEDLQIQGSCKR